MGKLIVTEFMTLDGVAQAPGGPEEDGAGGFAHGGWQAPMVDEASGQVVYEQASAMGALLLGRRTYQIFAGYWPTAPADAPFTRLLNGVPKHVASRTLSGPLAWQGSSLITGDLAEEVATVKADHDEVHVIGSLELLQSLLPLGCIDRLQLWVFPLVLGGGKRVFAAGTVPAALRLTHSATYPSGALNLVYEPAGAPTYGTVGVND